MCKKVCAAMTRSFPWLPKVVLLATSCTDLPRFALFVGSYLAILFAEMVKDDYREEFATIVVGQFWGLPKLSFRGRFLRRDASASLNIVSERGGANIFFLAFFKACSVLHETQKLELKTG